MARHDVGAGRQQHVAFRRRAVQVILHHAQADFLVVGIVALFYRGERQGAHQGIAVVAAGKIGAHPGGAFGPALGDDGIVDAAQNLVRRQAVGTTRHAVFGAAVAGRMLHPQGTLVDERTSHVEQLDAVRVVELVEEPAQRIGVLVAVVRHGEITVLLHLQDDPGGGRLDDVNDGLRVPAGQKQVRNGVDPRHVGLFVQRLNQLMRLLWRQRLVVRHQVGFRLLQRAGRQRRFRLVFFTRQQGPGNLAGHFVCRVPARAHSHVGHAGVQHVVSLIPADGLADFERRAGTVGLVTGGV